MRFPRFRLVTPLATTLSLLLLVSAGALFAAERVVIPTPPGGGPGVTIYPPDRALSIAAAHGPSLAPKDETGPIERLDPSGAPKTRVTDDIGGDDAYVAGDAGGVGSSIDIAENGDIYVAYEVDFGARNEIRVYRSRDGGDSWESWGQLASGVYSYESPCLHVAEGAANRCFLAYVRAGSGTDDICVAASDLSLATGDFTAGITVMDNVTEDFLDPDLTSDAASFDSYYLYLVATCRHTDGRDIYFARSVDQGASFEAHYAISSLTSGTIIYEKPDVSYGFGGYVHVAWDLDDTSGGYDAGLRYRRAASYAGGGLPSWGTLQGLGSNTDGIDQDSPQIAASLVDAQVVIACRHDDPIEPVATTGVYVSADQGVAWTLAAVQTGGLTWLSDLEKQASSGDWIMGGRLNLMASLARSDGSDVTSWSEPEMMSDSGYVLMNRFMHMALDPSRADQAAFSFVEGDGTGPDVDSLLFDGEWRGGPGYPNMENGFPVDLDTAAVSPPALVDLDDDGDREIVFGDANGKIQVFHHDGSVMAGWPVTVPGGLSDGPVAIGDLEESGRLLVIAGTRDGRAFAYETDGSLAAGWPFDTGQGTWTYVSIGAFGGSTARYAAVASGQALYWVRPSGTATPYHYSWPGRTIIAPVAIGDIDGDGRAEAIGAASEQVFAVHADGSAGVFGRFLPSSVSDAVTLGDFDGDGDADVVVPTEDGSLYLMDEQGDDFPGSWPFVSVTGSPLSSGAIANCLGGSEPEIAVAANDWHVHLVYDDGAEQSGYPVQVGGWRLYGMPVMGFLYDPYSADVVIGARGYRAWAWDNFGSLVNGWPKDLDVNIYETPAIGDIDLDGRAEIVFAGFGQLIVVDVNQVVAPPWRGWPMYGFDPQRTGCADCPEEFATGVAVAEEAEGVTLVSFAPPAPNPVTESTAFRFALPGRAQVRLDVFDVRGRRVRTVVREEAGPGVHEATWDGRDEGGRELASGRYFARLRVRGPGVDETRARPLTLLRR